MAEQVAADVPAAALHWAHGRSPNAFAGTSNATWWNMVFKVDRAVPSAV
jgi:hypothetical protein